MPKKIDNVENTSTNTEVAVQDAPVEAPVETKKKMTVSDFTEILNKNKKLEQSASTSSASAKVAKTSVELDLSAFVDNATEVEKAEAVRGIASIKGYISNASLSKNYLQYLRAITNSSTPRIAGQNIRGITAWLNDHVGANNNVSVSEKTFYEVCSANGVDPNIAIAIGICKGMFQAPRTPITTMGGTMYSMTDENIEMTLKKHPNKSLDVKSMKIPNMSSFAELTTGITYDTNLIDRIAIINTAVGLNSDPEADISDPNNAYEFIISMIVFEKSAKAKASIARVVNLAFPCTVEGSIALFSAKDIDSMYNEHAYAVMGPQASDMDHATVWDYETLAKVEAAGISKFHSALKSIKIGNVEHNEFAFQANVASTQGSGSVVL